jgi:hypothetical protein
LATESLWPWHLPNSKPHLLTLSLQLSSTWGLERINTEAKAATNGILGLKPWNSNDVLSLL